MEDGETSQLDAQEDFNEEEEEDVKGPIPSSDTQEPSKSNAEDPNGSVGREEEIVMVG